MLNDKQNVFARFRLLMSNLLKMGQSDELINQMKRTFNNNSKRFYHLMLDNLMLSVQKKTPNITISNKKDIFRYLDNEDILSSFMLMYLIFSGIYVTLDRLSDMFRQLCDDLIQEDTAIDKNDGSKSQKSQGRVDNNLDVHSDENKTANLKSSLLLDRDMPALKKNQSFIMGNRKLKVFLTIQKEEMDGIMKSTSSYFINKFVK